MRLGPVQRQRKNSIVKTNDLLATQNHAVDNPADGDSSVDKPKPGRARGWKSRLRRWTIMFGSVYLILLLLLLVFERTLVYPGSVIAMGDHWADTSFEYEEVDLESRDGTKLYGWFLPRTGLEGPGRIDHTILMFYGNGDNVANFANRMGARLRLEYSADVFIVDYRGFGKSEGLPFEQGVLEDAESAMKWLNEKTGTQPGEVVVLGHSLGGGVAVHVASRMGAKALILQRTFDSLANVAQDRFWWFPIHPLISNRYPSAEKIKHCGVPLFESHGTLDRNVPIRFGRRLFDASPAEVKEFYVIEGGTHHSRLDGSYFKSLGLFLEKIESPQREPSNQAEARAR